MTNSIDKSSLSYNLSRVDRSIADNLMDIDKSFGKDAQNVLDFIIFISKKLNNNLFGFTKFTIKEYSEFTGISPQNLCAIHPDVTKDIAGDITYSDHRFESVLEYTLLKMLKNNILFSKVISYKDDGNIITLKNFPILKDINIQGGNVLGTKKVYEVRLSDVMMDGFVQRYYTLDTVRIPIIGKGKGGHNRKKIYIWLNKVFHIYASSMSKEQMPLYSVDYLADIAGVRYKKELDKDKKKVEKDPKHKKEAVSNILKSIYKNINDDKNKLHFSFEYKFTSDVQNSYQEDYFVQFDFTSNMHSEIVTQQKVSHNLKFMLLKELRKVFDQVYPVERLSRIEGLESEKDNFQRWLNNNGKDLSTKITILKSCYFKANGYDKKKELTDKEATGMIYNGFLSLDPVSIPPRIVL
jgi:hypothetical protein